MIKLIVDSTTDLPKSILEQYDIKMVPLRVNIEDIEYLDKVTITVEEVYDYLRKGNYAKTSQPNPVEIENTVKPLLEQGHDIIFITFSSKLSGTYQTIHLVLEQLKEEYKQNQLKVIDSKGGSGASGLIALQAAKLISKRHSFKNIVDNLSFMANHVEHIFTIDNLKYLLHGGRINKTEAVIGNLLRIKPILHVVDGEIEFLQKVRGSKKALETIVSHAMERIKDFPNQIIAVMHADDLERANKLRTMLEDKLGHLPIIMEKIGSTLGTHLGIGGVGVFFFNQKPTLYELT